MSDRSLDERPAGHRALPARVVTLSLLAITAIGVVDALSGPDLSVLTFYFLPVLFSTWFAGRTAGVALSCLTAIEWLAIDWAFSRNHLTGLVSAWNTAIHLAFFIFGVWMVGTLKESREREEAAVRARAEQEIETAREVQSALLSSAAFGPTDALELSASCDAAQGISGDFYDVDAPRGGDVLITLGDVSGKGIPAALLGAAMLGCIRSAASTYARQLDALVAHADEVMRRSTPATRYVTMFLAGIDLSAGVFRWVNAGHVAGLYLPAGVAQPLRLVSSGPVVGLLRHARWTQHEQPFGRGDLLVLVSDGITETVDEGGEEFGESALASIVRGARDDSADAIRRRILEAAARFSGGTAPQDDRTIVVFRRIR